MMDTTIIVAVISGVIQAVKLTGKVNTSYIPLLSLGLGLFLGGLFNFSVAGVIDGATWGLGAVGLYEILNIKLTSKPPQ